MGRPRKNPVAAHECEWVADHSEVLGRVRFRIDVCGVDGCIERRACRLAGAGAMPAPERSVDFDQFCDFTRALLTVPKAEIDAALAARPRATRPKRDRCHGEGMDPERVTRAELVYRLASSGREHHVGGRGICPMCGTERSVTRGKVGWHYRPKD